MPERARTPALRLLAAAAARTWGRRRAV